ncbi:unnamed protein product [Ixodes persulcatus]
MKRETGIVFQQSCALIDLTQTPICEAALMGTCRQIHRICFTFTNLSRKEKKNFFFSDGLGSKQN